VNTLVFAGGIGENSPVIRERICANLTFFGITLDPSRNALHAPVISLEDSPVTVRIIPTDASLMIARAVESMLAQTPAGNSGSIGS